MKCLRLFSMLSAIFVLSLSLSSICFAVESADSSASDDSAEPVADESVVDDTATEEGESDEIISEEPVADESIPEESVSGDSSSDEPIPVIIIEPETSFYSVSAASDGTEVTIVDEPPSNPPFYGSCYVTGTDSELGRITVYFPSNYKTGYFGVDSSGYLFNVSSNSITGYLSGVYNNSVSAPGFSYPRYRLYNSSSQYTYLHLIPESSNMDIATANSPRVSASDLLPYVSVFLLGVIIVCFMKRS